MNTHVVTRPFKADGRELKRGDKVDATNWRSRDSLVAQRRLEPLPAKESKGK